MSKRTKLIGTLFVLANLIQSYLGQISHVTSEQVAKWTIHDWTGSLLFVLLAGITAWKTFVTNPSEITGAEQRLLNLYRMNDGAGLPRGGFTGPAPVVNAPKEAAPKSQAPAEAPAPTTS